MECPAIMPYKRIIARFFEHYSMYFFLRFSNFLEDCLVEKKLLLSILSIFASPKTQYQGKAKHFANKCSALERKSVYFSQITIKLKGLSCLWIHFENYMWQKKGEDCLNLEWLKLSDRKFWNKYSEDIGFISQKNW